jgi:hypothetical protein
MCGGGASRALGTQQAKADRSGAADAQAERWSAANARAAH